MNTPVRSLIGKISLIVILVEIVMFTCLGMYYTNRFSSEIDRRLKQNIQLPGILMNHQLLKYQAISDRDILTELLGEEIVDGQILGTDGSVYYAMNSRARASAISELPEPVGRWIDEGTTETNMLKVSDAQDTFLISLTPLVAYEGQAPFYYVYLKIKTNRSEQRKVVLIWMFIIGSVASVGFTSLLILWFIRRVVTAPLAELEDNARQIARGYLGQDVNIRGNDELGSLAQSFTCMRDAVRQKISELQELNQTLEQKVESRTKELHESVKLLEQEVAERKRAQEALTTSNRLLEAVIKQAPFGIHVLVGDFHQFHATIENDESRRILGESIEGQVKIDADVPETLLSRFFTVDGGTEVPLARMPGSRAFQGESITNEEYLIRQPDRTDIIIQASASPVYDGAAHIIAVLVTFHDITERKRTEEALHESQERYIKAQKMGKVGNWEYNVQNTLFWGSDEAKKIYGFEDTDHFTTEEVERCIPEREKVHQALVDLVEHDAPYDLEFDILTQNTQERKTILSLAQLERDTEGTPLKITGVIQDITKRKRMEEALRDSERQIRKLNASLEARVARRTRELEAANKELRSFAYVVSHDLKAPLRGISRLAAWLVEDYADVIDDKGREMSALLIGRVKRMDDLIDGILQYSRIGRIRTTQETLDLGILIRSVIDSLDPPEHIQITVETELPVMLGERIHLTHLFQNLLSNAVKFMDKAEGRITIGSEDHDTFCTFWVSDNGRGLDRKYHEKIFQIFQTLHPRDEEENTGVGLAIVKKIIELYNGKIWVTSEPGTGSTFSFTLPKNPPQE